MKTSELSGAALDWAVCIANGLKPEDIYIQKWGKQRASLFRRNRDEEGELDGSYTTGPDLLFSHKWEAGGPIIEQEKLDVLYMGDGVNEHYWRAEAVGGFTFAEGLTPLIAAMRCFVASRLGEEVEVPKELL